ncbi:phosphoacetylglucosamine mutase [Orussus abietinus]|uniref:phosphoacetylglucosamine mutase n=1 Tax=Orussus abietinus TaxID=222816 RepID=UPI0006265571|nr:phosphoacetylglucosamine mutase [Orussus abietinus]
MGVNAAIQNAAITRHPKTYKDYIPYGTAGFRTRSDILDFVMYRMGVLAVLRSMTTNAAIGVMITASHNPEVDNGVKLVDPAGEMLEMSWEKIATELANVNDSDIASTLQRIVKEKNINTSKSATVVIGRDTRKSSPSLTNAVLDGATVAKGQIKDFGIVTTPQLHYLVVCTNTTGGYGIPTVEGYYLKLSKAFKHVRNGQRNNGKYIAEIQLDAANGVGAIAMKEFQNHLGDSISVEIFNDGRGELNHKCGADYVKVQQKNPENVPIKPNARCVTIDGDADRALYYYTDENNKFHLLDGDRISTLVASYFKELLEESQLNLKLGLVQTAYANGGSTDYITNVLKVPVSCVSTGVKYLHHEAKKFDIGVYFEANGHGTVTVNDDAIKIIREAQNNTSLSSKERLGASKLVTVIDIINQTVGDALSDMLLVETILHAKGWDLATWESSYKDLPYKQLQVKVQDRNIISTTDAERKCLTPIGLQQEIDNLVLRYNKGRAFVRPSGTEDVVRIYAEAEVSADTDKLAAEVATAVYRLAGGIGPELSIST